MATFTIPLWRVLELTDDGGTGQAIGLADYPIPADWTSEFRLALNEKIIRHYWNREIGTETIALFTCAVYRRMWEAMPYFCQLYESQMLVFDPLSTVKLTTTRDDETTEHGTSSSSQDSTTAGTATQGSRAISSEFPQMELSGNEDYASSGADSTGTSGTTGTSSGTGTETNDGTTNATGTSTTAGYQSAAADLLQRYRATFLNVDMLVIESLADCFLQVWDNGQELLPADPALSFDRLDLRL